MKRQNKKLITLLLAGVCAASLSVATYNVLSSADETTAVTYSVSDVFSSNGTLGSKKVAEKETVSFTLGNEQYARLKRDLAFKWFEAKEGAKYLSMEFSFEELNFKSVTFEFESASTVATEDDKAVNAIEFTVVGDKIHAAVINADTTDDNKASVEIGSSKDIKLSLKSSDTFGCYKVELQSGSETAVTLTQEFTNVAGSYADYTLDKVHPLEIVAKTDSDKKAVIFMKEINGQKFDNVADMKVTDTAAPVLVVNEEVSSFQYGTAFSLAYEKVDVLQSSGLTETKKYYQYNPTDTEVKYDDTLTTSTYFMDTVYYTNGTENSATEKEGYTVTSVRAQEGKEYIAVQFSLTDKSKNEKVYDLSWYAASAASKTLGSVATDYIVIDENTDGPTYRHIKAENDQNTVDGALATESTEYQALVNKAAENVAAGSSSSVKLPDVDWMITDNGGYRGLRFTISYKTPSSSSAKTSSGLSYNGLKITTTEEGLYEFKIFATDKAGNSMKYYLDGELVDVSTSNIWDIEEIPSFTFEIKDSVIKVEEPTSTSDKKVERIKDKTYSLSGLKVVGAESEQSSYALYRLNRSALAAITDSSLINVKYEKIREKAATAIAAGDVTDYFDLYLDIYAEEIASATNLSADVVKACFTRIDEYNARITEENDKEAWEAYNKYNWNSSAKSFNTAEEGDYVIIGDFWEKELPMQRAVAYKLIVVESEADVIKGESKFEAWVKANTASTVLFAVAGVLLIAIVILAIVKPADEKLEEVEENAKKAKKKKSK